MSGEYSNPRLGLGRRRESESIPMYRELLTCYQKILGPTATLLWINLRYLAQHGGGISFAEASDFVGQGLGLGLEDFERELARLVEWGLVGAGSDNAGVLVHDPLDEESFEALATARRATLTQSAAVAAVDEDDPPAAGAGAVEKADLARDLESVFELYQQRIGLLGPMQYEKIRFWVEQMGMDAAVVGMAIDETARSAENPRINYLEGILRNWHNDGIRTATELVRHLARREAALDARNNEAAASPITANPGLARRQGAAHGATGRVMSYEGVANAGAYRKVDAELVKRWKEMYPDEYDD